MQHGALGAERGRDPRDGVGAAGSRGRNHAAELAGLTGVAVRGMRRDLLVAHVDDADALIDATVVDVDDVAAAESEDGIDALVLQGPGDQMAAGDDAGVPALALERVFRGGRAPGFRGLGRRLLH